ncbi:S-adenosylmethionine decarboxylase proenzyme [Zalerion maritima]|uniref:S-adenosylmethionine decarboxylase proenzyme n=1 Tax=Zalerion maritima TaxID=339359 RepID=A0AAD5RHK1_9PEZI|nr:S-adenosylmethionine decarboxylase proenzyme [Zalerion maritima]
MVNFEAPTAHSFTPSEATPHLTINHDVAADLDSSNAFEGPEKLLEVWFAPSADALPPTAKENGLKSVPSEIWVPMLDMVSCKVLSVLDSEHVDAYLLSESSMFVWPHKIILKTCGTTTLLLGLHRMLHIAAEHAGFPFHNATSLGDIKAAATPYRVFYSRKNFLFPDKQQGPHKSWNEEVKFLDDTFENGSAYMVGKMNGDHWYLYITSPSNAMTPPRTPEGGASPTRLAKIPTGVLTFNQNLEENNDETLEILMTDLDPENAKQFYLENASAVACDKHVSQSRGLDQIPSNGSGMCPVGNMTGSMTASTSGSLYDETFDVFSNGGDSDMPGTHTPLSEHAIPECYMTEGHALGKVVTDNCGLADVYPTSKYPDARIDSFLFTPCGFSANGLVPAADDGNGSTAAHYFTVHVTPESNCSYASFETNVPGGQKGRATADIIDHVVRIFKPSRFSVTLFEAKDKGTNPYDPLDEDRRTPTRKKRLERICGYRRIDRIVHDFDDYELVFRFYEREDWVGGGMRVGEMMI